MHDAFNIYIVGKLGAYASAATSTNVDAPGVISKYCCSAAQSAGVHSVVVAPLPARANKKLNVASPARADA